MIGTIFFTILSLVLSSASLAQRPDRLCVLDPTQMPESWRPSAEVQKNLNPALWSESEAKDAEYAIKSGLDEMIGYFKRKPSAVESLGDDSIEALIQVTYSSANKPEFDAKTLSREGHANGRGNETRQCSISRLRLARGRDGI